MNREDDLIQYYTIDEIHRLSYEIAKLKKKRFYSRRKLDILLDDLQHSIEYQLLELVVSVNVHHAILKEK